MLAYFLEKLQATPDGDGSLLDHSLILYGGGMGDGNLHRHADLPCLMAGKLGGQFKTGRHLDYPQDTPMANLLVTTARSRRRADREARRQHRAAAARLRARGRGTRASVVERTLQRARVSGG